MPSQKAWEEARETGWFHDAELEGMRGLPDETIRAFTSYREAFIRGCEEYLGYTEEEVVEMIMEQGELVAMGLSDDWLPPDLRKDLEDVSP